MKQNRLSKLLSLCAVCLCLCGLFLPMTVRATEAVDPVTEENAGEGEEATEEQVQEMPAPEYVINLPVAPNIYLTVFTEYEWYNTNYAVAHVIVSDVAQTGEWELASLRARIGRNGNWFDITQDKSVVLSENGSLYISITDTEGNIYEKSVNITCFDYEKPYLNAALSDGVLLVQPYDALSGVRAIYINGYEFLEETFIRGNLSVRLQQFDASFPYFVVQAVDKAGNVSDVYRFNNPYYVAPDGEDNENGLASQLPTNALPSAPSEAVGEVTDHMETDSDGNSIDYTYSYTSDTGRVFYTIQTQSGKVFYLIIDRDGNGERAYFLTEIDENDLLNAPSDVSQTLPQNSTATANNVGMIPDIVVAPDITESNIPAAQAEAMEIDNPEEKMADISESIVSEDTVSGNEIGSSSNTAGNILIIVGGAIFVVVAYFVKVKKPKGKKQTDEAIEDEDDEIPMEDEED